ncbi:MAG TPA: SH3 domain-containing protein [Geminicoccaceae bacterium]|nr:SH3 domain-containing protein [Geminicoccaceae bacterium]
MNLRDGPMNRAAVLAVVPEGDMVRRLGRDGSWLRVAYTDRSATVHTGWVHGSFLRSAEVPPRGGGPSARTDG